MMVPGAMPMSPATDAATATVASRGETRVVEPPVEVGQAEDEERDREEDREVGGLPGRGVVGGLVVLEGMEQVPDGEQRCRRRTARCAASRGGRRGTEGSAVIVSTGAVGWFWSWVMAASPAWRCGYGVSAYMRIHCIRVKPELDRDADTVCPCHSHPPELDRAARPSDRSSTPWPRSSPPRTSMRSPCAGSRPRPTCRCPPSSGTSAPRTPCWPRSSARAARTRSATRSDAAWSPATSPPRSASSSATTRRPAQQLMHMLAQEHRFPALSELLDLGRRGHRTWVRWAFSPQLAGRRSRRKDPARGPAGRRHRRLHVEAPPHRPSAQRASDRGRR